MALNQVNGTTGDDVFLDSSGGNHYFGGAGNDTVDFSEAPNGVVVNLSIAGVQDVNLPGFEQFSGIESLVGSAFGDTLIGRDSLVGSIFGGDGDDHIKGGPNGSTGPKTLDGGTGNDQIEGNNGSDTIIGGSGNDHLQGGGGDDSLDAGAGNDGLAGGAGNDQVTGGAGTDRMSGGAGADVFHLFSGDTGLVASDRDTILDFTQGQDVIDLHGGVYLGSTVFPATGGQTTGHSIAHFSWDGGATLGDVNLSGVTTQLTATNWHS